MPSVTLISQPDFFCPLNNYNWFNSSSNWSNLPNFKYVYKVLQIDPSSSDVLTDFGVPFKVPPSPDGDSFFSPNDILKTKFGYDFQYLSLTSQISNNWIKYAVQYGLDTDLTLNYYDEFFSSSFVGLTFSYAHELVVGMVIDITAFSTVNPQYNATASITSIPNAFSVVTNIPWGANGPTIGGEVRIPYLDTFQYITGQGSLGLSFSGRHFFQVGDIITIDKTNKIIDLEYDGTASVVASTTYSIAVDKQFQGTQSTPGINGGFISKLSRMSGTSSFLYGYNGTRQYNERTRNFGLSFSLAASTLTSNGATAAGFLTNYEGWKEIPPDVDEMSGVFIQTGSGIIKLELKTYDAEFNQVNDIQVDFTSSTLGYVIGTGTKNVLLTFGASALNGATYYEVFFNTISNS